MDIDYGGIVKQAFNQAKRHKWLLIYGLLLAGGTGSSFNSSYNSSDLKNLFNQDSIDGFPPTPSAIPHKTSQVLGAFTSSIGTWFRSVDTGTWLALVGSLAVVVIFAWLIGWVIRSWATGSLIGGLQLGETQSVDLRNTSPLGVKSIKPLITFELINFVITTGFILALLAVGLIGMFAFSFSEGLRTVWLGLAAILGSIIFIIGVLLLTMTSIFAQRLIVLKSITSREAWKQGFALSRKFFLNTSVMGIVSSGTGCAISCLGTIITLLIFAIPAVVLIFPLVSNPHFPGIPSMVAIIILAIGFLTITSLVQAFVVVFKFSTWNIYFHKVLGSIQPQKENEA